MAATPLTDAQLESFLAAHPGWALEGGMLCRTFEAETFLRGIDFVNRVARIAEVADHHPDIDIRWRKVTLRLITHDAGNRVTEKDSSLAAEASLIFAAL